MRTGNHTLLVSFLGVSAFFILACSEGGYTGKDTANSSDCPEELIGDWTADQSAYNYYDTTSTSSASSYCVLEGLVMEMSIGGTGDDGHAMGSLSVSGTETFLTGGTPTASDNFADRIASPGYRLLVADLWSGASGKVDIDFWAGTPKGGGVSYGTASGHLSGDTISIDSWTVDPTWNGTYDSINCTNFYFEDSITFTRTSSSGSTGLSRWNSAADEDDEQFVDCTPEEPVDTGDTSDTGADASYNDMSDAEWIVSMVPNAPGGWPVNGHVPASNASVVSNMWLSISAFGGSWWSTPAHAMWDALFVVPNGGTQPPFTALIGPAANTPWPGGGTVGTHYVQIRTNGNALIDAMANPNNDDIRDALTYLAAGFVASNSPQNGLGLLEWRAMFIVTHQMPPVD